ncbi:MULTISPECIES: hypothetical protein [unclassified Rathayibacter]|uniref:hypothetical protein n=1 Tax=unclassified Rathayibacter TaxID=2609250 RepID=UPI000701925B|nr:MULTISPECIES: hypothetical protein [unclassified Rathayibacter]KQQ06006.1 hypothetical protein ASF42_05585 [Rathayibacter sp. Leaf294]KQS13863.1 hypothetical protein ASG06_05595 [Rathayibacter sp. Leaf185]
MQRSAGEIAGTFVVVVAAIGLLVAAFAFGAGHDIAFVGVITAFAVGVTGIGVHIAGRESRFRRDKR